MTGLSIDQSRCQGHARCYMLAPDTFLIDEEGYGHVIEGREGAYQEEHVRKAVRNCPERSIKVIAPGPAA
ncbi:ferredoxin [Micromonospora radicis]|uniref:Ferredoxin n=1 Tax=Micromonospora radicis TaxID=1894971 RepID=A0A418MUQ0_9ACTN|nr:ferredoxin [Micromonospora radicis]RIV37960.1 ferredoxin [Micromonospora radicis]